jgi:acyl-CoA synthetase (AMP-forming)/AMP-acid ligase II
MTIAIAPALAALAAAIPDREALVHRSVRRTWRELDERIEALGGALAAHGLGPSEDPSAGHDGWHCPQHRIALYLHNCPEYLEAMGAAFAARAVPVNVNYRYGGDELRYLFDDCDPRALVYHRRFAPLVADVREAMPADALLVHVDDDTDEAPVAGSMPYESLMESSRGSAAPLVSSCDPADRYILYTGGTTGMPKGVLWRQGDFVAGALAVRTADEDPHDGLIERARRRPGPVALPAAPFMHGAAHWSALSTWLSGGTVVIPDRPATLDVDDLLGTCERERVTSLLIVGDAFARPIVDGMRAHPYDLGSLRHVITGGAILSDDTKKALLALVPGLEIVDILGSSESGRQAVSRSADDDEVRMGHFRPGPSAAVVSADMDRVLRPGSPEMGWLAQRGHVPTGYLGDPDKTAATFPVIDGIRWAVPGDRARWLDDGTIELHGRESVTINTGGEKVFAEEVEHAVKSHPAVLDAGVVGRPSERWGQAVAAVVQLRTGAQDPGDEALIAHVKGLLASYKAPRSLARVDHVVRSPAGKADYRWARSVFDAE